MIFLLHLYLKIFINKYFTALKSNIFHLEVKNKLRKYVTQSVWTVNRTKMICLWVSAEKKTHTK